MTSSAYSVQAASRELFIEGMRNVACSVSRDPLTYLQGSYRQLSR